ncbi:MAG: hypothetical protein MMC23_004138 [Stictis urceolatum]|nr:hypothetical protein [Stictis urceolata]
MRPLSLFVALPLVSAWAPLGHRTVAYLSTLSFEPSTSLFVSTVFANDVGHDISDQAVWPDLIRKERPETMQWHFIDARDNPPEQCGVVYKRDCELGGVAGCVVSALKNMTSILLDPNSSAPLLKEALIFTIHLIGDVHQPMHTEFVSYGGNLIPVCFDGQCGREVKANLHSVWDAWIPGKMRNVTPYGQGDKEEKKEALEWASELYNKTLEASWSNKAEGECINVTNPEECSLAWANESNEWVCEYAMKDGVEWLKTHDLGGEYYTGAAPVVQAMVGKAGMRLGSWLNAIVEERLKRIGKLAEDKEASMGKLIVQAEMNGKGIEL